MTNSHNILTTNETEIQALHALSDREIFDLILSAPPKADLLRASVMRRFITENPRRLAAIAGLRSTLAPPDLPVERNAMIHLLMTTALRRQVPERPTTAEIALETAKGLIIAVRDTDQDWADRLTGAAEHEAGQIQILLGQFDEAAERHLTQAAKGLKSMDPAAVEQGHMDLYYWALHRFNAALMSDGDRDSSYDVLNAQTAGIITMAKLHPDDSEWEKRSIEVQLDLIRAEWLMGEGAVDSITELSELKGHIESHPGLKADFAWTLWVLWGAVMLACNDRALWMEGLATARQIADNSDIGAAWRPEAMLVVAELYLKLGDRTQAKRYLSQILALPDYHGVAGVIAARLMGELNQI